MAIPAPVSPAYQGLSGEEAVEAEEDFYCKWRFHVFVLMGEERWAYLRALVEDRVGLLYLYQLGGGGGYRRGGDGSGGGELLKRAKGSGSRRWEYSNKVWRKLDSSAESHLDIEAGRTWNDNIIWVKGNCLQRDDEEPLDLQFRFVKQSIKSTVEMKESLLDEVAEDETKLELVLGELSLSRKKKVESRSKKVAKAQSTREEERIEPLGGSEEKVAEVRSVSVDDLKEVEERARLAILQGREDTNHMVAHLVKGIWLSIEEHEFELKKAKNELEKNLARAKTDALKEVKQQKVTHAVAIGQLQVEAKATLDETAEECDRLSRHLMLKGYSQEEVNAIKADTYAEKEEEGTEVLGVVDNLNGVSPQTVFDNQGDDVELPEGGSEKCRCDGLNERVTRLKAERDHAIDRAKKAEAREHSGGSKTVIKASLVQGDVVSLSGHIRELKEEVKRLESERDTLLKTPSNKGYTCGVKIDRGNCLGVMETQLGPGTADLVERGRVTVARELKDRPLDDVWESIADTPSVETNHL
ncbi:hypothetical protein GIB67_012829 [Kingdonia uniflora]|uniref:Uncharacterized protein n=1 Tax=Kingdonia uniflora TaxID=39325 RepID=A0A7J7NG21_9MAGN|nr:hypothetical protein GIB67_012829 [Kingdonia uniflora]